MVMRRVLLYIFLVFAVGPCCSTVTVTPSMKKVTPIFYADQEFIPHIDKFLKLSKRPWLKIRNHTVFGTLGYSDPEDDSSTVGLCEYFFKRVTIDDYYWKWLSETGREALIFHELGHCTLFRGHTDIKEDDGTIEYKIENFLFSLGVFEKKGYLKDGCPASIMHPYMFSDKCLKKHRKYYMEELFNPSKYNIKNTNARNILKSMASKIENEEDSDCPETKKKNLTELPWTKHDNDQLKWVKDNDRCEEQTGLKCVRQFIKSGHRMHRVLCGPTK